MQEITYGSFSEQTTRIFTKFQWCLARTFQFSPRTRTRTWVPRPGTVLGLHSQGPGFEYKDQDLSKCGHISVNIPDI